MNDGLGSSANEARPSSIKKPITLHTLSIVVIALGVKGLDIGAADGTLGMRTVEHPQSVIECLGLVSDCRAYLETYIGCRSGGAYRYEVGHRGAATILHRTTFNGL